MTGVQTCALPISDFVTLHTQLRRLLRHIYPYFLTYRILERYADLRSSLRRPYPYNATFLALRLSALTMGAICLVITPLGPRHDSEALRNRIGMQG